MTATSSCCDTSCATSCDMYTPFSYHLLFNGSIPTNCLSSIASSQCSKAAGKEEDFDLFGESSAADKEAVKELAEKKKAEAKPKKVIISKSSLVIEIKPNSVDTELDQVLALVKKIEINGVTWGEASKKVPVAFGLYKLQVSCTIIDDLVTTEDITDAIEALGLSGERAASRLKRKDAGEDQEEEEEGGDGLVQSADIVSFNKL
eukprot:GHVS01012278.1.p1 GENE.GHVS01012278.1~~GHVS01012278.1.p1  ORF type:complete len:204 (+),score=49.45 GHVS01012278.1:466-1077(+)